jgi:hypothetical protein
MVEYNQVELETYRGFKTKLYEGTVNDAVVDTKSGPFDAMVFKQATFFLNVSVFNPTTKVGTTIAFVNATHKITDSGNGLAGFLTGDKITVSGSVANDGTYTIVTGGVAGEIVVSESLTDGGAGPSVTIKSVKTLDVKIVTQDPVSLAWLDLKTFTQKTATGSEVKNVTANLGHKIAVVVTPNSDGTGAITLTVGAVFQIM